MKIYLDTCCFGRPFDNQDFTRIFLEAQAKVFIQEQIKAGKIELATSYILHYENSQCPFETRKDSIEDFLKTYSSTCIDVNFSEQILKKDACHVASAILAECDYFLTVDARLLKYKSSEIVLMNPVDFLKILEEELK